MQSVMAAAFTITRGFGIFVSMRIKPNQTLYAHFLVIIVGNVLLWVYAQSSSVMLWVGNILIGIGCSSVYPGIYALIQENITVTNSIGAIFLSVGGTIAAFYPSLVGSYIKEKPLVLIYINVATMAVCFTALILIHIVVHKRSQRTSLNIVALTN